MDESLSRVDRPTPEGVSKSEAALTKMLRFNRLFDHYGELLTERQQRICRMHFQEDMSFAEIADLEECSRQAAHDAVKQAGQALEKYEARLGLVERGGNASLEDDGPPKAAAGEGALTALKNLRERLAGRREMMTTEQVIEALDGAIDQLEG